MTFVWVFVTLVTDWNTVFYRKAIIYKKRLQEEARENQRTSIIDTLSVS